MTAVDTEQAERPYSADEVRRLAKVSVRQLTYWLESGRLPDHRPENARTSGHPLAFTHDDVATVRLVVHLLRVGFVLDRAFAIASALVTDDEYRAEFADIFEIKISVRDIAAEPPTSEETP